MWTVFISGMMLGLVSSLHCIGMCGPLLLSLPGARARTMLTYHAGRIFVYSVLGLLSGLVGGRAYLAGIQQWLSIGMGVLVLLMVLLPGRYPMAAPTRWLQNILFRCWRYEGKGKFLVLGMANGLLPCGMVYLAAAAALSLSGGWQGLGLMVAFGLGTLPALLGVAYLGRVAKPGFRIYMRKLVPIAMGLMGVLLILRGLGLGIPFVSPVLYHGPGQVISCH